jgi:hypothetical protein
MDGRRILQTLTPGRTAALATVAALAVVWLTRPYDVARPSAILLSDEVYERIQAIAKTDSWPQTDADPRYQPGPRAQAEAEAPTFRLMRVEPTTAKGRSAVYVVTIRGQDRTVRVRIAD